MASEQATRVTDWRRERRWKMVELKDHQQLETEALYKSMTICRGLHEHDNVPDPLMIYVPGTCECMFSSLKAVQLEGCM